jgi:rhodanese-related sulfurtransferase
VNIPQAELATRLDELPRERSILVICQTGSRSRHATEFLTQTGFTDVANVLGGSSAWRRAGKPLVREERASSTRS